MEAVTFDDLENLNAIEKDKPFFAIDLTNDDTVLNWLKDELASLRKQSQTRLEKSKNNYLRYKGMQYFNAVYQPRDVLESQKKYTPQMVMPLISDFIDEKVSRIMELKPGIAVLPKNDESKDKSDAKAAKKFLAHVDHNQKLDGKYQKLLRNANVMGESFLWTRWNPDLGDKLKDLAMVKTEDGQPVDQAQFQGDTEVLHKTMNWVFYENALSWQQVNYCFVIELDYVEALKLDNPEVADKITSDMEAKVFDYDSMEQVDLKGKCRKVYFYHKKTKYLPNGYEATFVINALLKKGPLSYEHGLLPIDRLIAVENDEELHGQSSIDKVRAIASNVNNLLNSMVKMFMLAGHAKWFVERGAVDPQQLNNDINIVNIKAGSKAPVLAQANPVGESHFAFVDKFISWFYKFSKSNSVVRGEPPPGVTAGVALQFVSESESRRSATDVANFNEVVRSLNEKILKTCGQFYREDDDRTGMLLGKDNRWENFSIDIKALKNDYAVMLQNTSGLSESKAVRIQQVIDLETARPGILPAEQFIEMTGLAQADKAYDVSSVAARASEDENEQMQDTGIMIEPEEYEDHVVHWRIHVQSIQPTGFKQKASDEVYKTMCDHILTHEQMMIDKAIPNPLYQQLLSSLPGFPMFASLPPPPDQGMPPGGPMDGPPPPMGSDQGPPPMPPHHLPSEKLSQQEPPLQ
jgi:hypothetical protein